MKKQLYYCAPYLGAYVPVKLVAQCGPGTFSVEVTEKTGPFFVGENIVCRQKRLFDKNDLQGVEYYNPADPYKHIPEPEDATQEES